MFQASFELFQINHLLYTLPRHSEFQDTPNFRFFLFHDLKAILLGGGKKEKSKNKKKKRMQIKVNLCSSYWRHKNWSKNALYSSRNNEFKTKRELNKQKEIIIFFF